MQEALEPMWTQGAQWDALIKLQPQPGGGSQRGHMRCLEMGLKEASD